MFSTLFQNISKEVSHIHKGVNYSQTVSERLIDVLIKVGKCMASTEEDMTCISSRRIVCRHSFRPVWEKS